MTWTAPMDWAVNHVVTSAELNAQLRDNMKWLHDNGSMVVRGLVNADGTLNSGSGFAVSGDGAGTYTITFTRLFGSLPIVVATSVNGTNIIPSVSGATTSGFQVKLYPVGAGGLTTGPFMFTAIES